MDQQVLQLDSSSESLLGDHHSKTLQFNPNISSNNIMDPLETSDTRSFISHLPTLTHFTDSISQVLFLLSLFSFLYANPHISTRDVLNLFPVLFQYSTFSEDDLHSIIHMGFAQNRESNQTKSHSFQGMES